MGTGELSGSRTPSRTQTNATKMLFSTLAFAVLAPITALALPASESHSDASLVARKPGENLCSLKAPPKLCVPNKNITVAETAQRAYDFYRAFVVDGDAEKMFSLIDDVYVVSRAPQAVLRCGGLHRRSNTTPATSRVRSPSGPCSATVAKLPPRRARRGALTRRRACRGPSTRRWIGGRGWMGVSMSTYVSYESGWVVCAG